MALATLSIDLTADVAKFEQGMDRAARAAETLATRMQSSFIGVKEVFVGNLLATAATELTRRLVSLYPTLIENVAGFQDLSDKTGIAASAIASFQTAADVSGTSMEKVAGLSVKLTAGLSKTSDESKGVGKALAALGLNLEQFRKLAPEQQIEEVAKALAGFEDGAGKTAVAVALFGRAGAEALPFLKDLAEVGRQQNGLTEEQIALADQYSKAQAKLHSQIRQIAQEIAVSTLPTVIAFKGALKDAAIEALGLGDATGKLDASKVQDFANNGAKALAFIIDAADGVGRVFELLGNKIGAAAAAAAAVASGEFKQAKAIFEESAAETDRILQRAQFSDRLQQQLDAQRRANEKTTGDFSRDDRSGPKKSLNGFQATNAGADKAAREAAQVRKAQLDAALKVLNDNLQHERDSINFQQRYVSGAYQEGLLSLRQYYDQRRSAIEQAATEEQRIYAEEIRAVQEYIRKTSDPSDRAAAQGKIDDLEEKRKRSQLERSRSLVLLAQDETQATKQLGDAVANFNANLAQLNGDEVEAARIRAQQAIDNAKLLAASAGDGQVNVDGLTKAIEQNNRLAEIRRDLSQVTERASIAEQAYSLAAERGGVGLIERERGLTAIRQAALEQLRQQLELTRRLSAERPNDEALKTFAKSLELEYAKAADAVDETVNRIRSANEALADSFANALGEFVKGKATLKETLRSFGDDLFATFTKLAITDPIKAQIKGALDSITTAQGGIADILKGDQSSGIFGGFLSGISRALGFSGSVAENTTGFGGGTAADAIKALPGAAPASIALSKDAALQSFTLATNAATEALQRLAVSIPAANQPALTTGDFSRADRAEVESVTTGDFARLDRGLADQTAQTARAMDGFGTSAQLATGLLSAMAQSTSAAGAAMAVLPTVIQLISASASSSNGGGFFSGLASAFTGGTTASANGNAFAGFGTVKAFAKGDMFDQPTAFRFANGGAMQLGVMGEAGPEAVMPLRRGADGRLGVTVNGTKGREAQPVQVTNHFVIQPGTSRDTQEQIASAASRGILKARSRGTA
jgi:hypothetical protein